MRISIAGVVSILLHGLVLSPAGGAQSGVPDVQGWLAEYPDHMHEVSVYLVLEAPPLATLDAVEPTTRAAEVRGLTRRQLSQRIEHEQGQLRNRLAAVGAQETHAFRVLVNALQVTVPRERVPDLLGLPGVVRVDPVGVYELTHTTSVPWVGAPQLWSGGQGLDGRGIRVGVIDSGIDYFHAHLGGAGRVQDYQNNDPRTVAPGTFPTAKVVGGWDFVGDDYHAGSENPARRVPQPDPDPVDCGGHGTHVAGTVAGYGVLLDGGRYDGPYHESLEMSQFRIGPGVAPEALLYAYKVFGCEGSTAVVAAALERAADPNQDGDTSDRLDVVNMSLGCNFACSSPTEMAMVANLTALGTVVVASAGNAGDVFFITGSPATAPGALSVAATYDDGITEFAVEVVNPEEIAGMYPAVEGGFTRPLAQTGTLQAGLVATQPADACSSLANGAALAGRIALIDRGSCRFDEKVARAQSAGAVAAVMANNVDGPPIVMGGDLLAGIPGVMVSRDDGALIRENLPVGVTMKLAPGAFLGRPELADRVVGFSSRGPSQDVTLVKPDMAAPGVAITSAAVGSGSAGATFSGTSMAAPHLAGAAALVRQLHPDWSAPTIKALLINHAAPAADGDDNPYSVSRVGAGRLALAGLELADFTVAVVGQEGEVTVGFGLVEAAEPTEASRTVRITNHSSHSRTLSVAVHPTLGAVGAAVVPEIETLAVPALGYADLQVSLAVEPEVLAVPPDPTTSLVQDGEVRHRLPEVGGLITFTDVSSSRSVSLPYHAVVRPATGVRAAGLAVCLPQAAGSLDLPLIGPIGHPEPLAAVFQLGREGEPLGVADPLRSAADVLAVGAASSFAATGSLATTTLYFALATRGDWPTLQPNLVRFEVLLDLNRNAQPDFELSTWTFGRATSGSETDTFVVMLRNRQTGDVTLEGFANVFRADQLDLPPFFNNVVVLPVRASSLGLTAGSGALDYYVRSFVRGTQVKSLGRGRFDPRQPLSRGALSGIDNSPFEALTDVIPIRVDPAVATDFPGVLLLFPHNRGPARWQVVPFQAGPGADLEVLAPGEFQVPLGGFRLLRVEVLNRGPVAAVAAALRVELPAHLAVKSAVGSGGECAESAGDLTCQLGDLSSDARGFVDLMVEGTGEGGASATFWVESQTCHPAPEAGVARTAIEVQMEPIAGPSLTIPSVARLQGVGAFFTSRVELFNAGSTPLEVDVVYTPRQDIPGSRLESALIVPPGIQQEVDDPLHAWFGLTDAQPAAGTLGFFVSAGREADLMVQSVVFARNPDGSEYGQFFPALPPGQAVLAGEQAFLSTTVDAVRNRLNLGIVGLEDETTVQVVPVDPVGIPLAAPRSFTLNAGVSRQLNDLNRGSAGFGLGDRSDYVIQLDVQSGAALGFVSVLDGTSQIPGTSDPTTILPVITGSTRQTLIGLGPVMGLNEFTGSASVTNLSNLPAVIRADFFARDDGQSGVAATATVNLGAGETRGFVDIVGDLFGLTGVGTVVLTSENNAEFFATGREYAVFRDEQEQITGTAGQLVPGLRDDQLLRPGLTYHLLGLRERMIWGALERSNLLVFNPGEDEQVLTIRLFDGATGAPEGSRTEAIPAGELRQLNRILSTLNPAQDGSAKRLEVTVGGPLFVSASRVNKDGDPVTILPQGAAD